MALLEGVCHPHTLGVGLRGRRDGAQGSLEHPPTRPHSGAHAGTTGVTCWTQDCSAPFPTKACTTVSVCFGRRARACVGGAAAVVRARTSELNKHTKKPSTGRLPLRRLPGAHPRRRGMAHAFTTQSVAEEDIRPDCAHGGAKYARVAHACCTIAVNLPCCGSPVNMPPENRRSGGRAPNRTARARISLSSISSIVGKYSRMSPCGRLKTSGSCE